MRKLVRGLLIVVDIAGLVVMFVANSTIAGVILGAGTASATPGIVTCPWNSEYHPDDGLCYEKPVSKTTNGCDLSAGAPVESQLKCWGDDWE